MENRLDQTGTRSILSNLEEYRSAVRGGAEGFVDQVNIGGTS